MACTTKYLDDKEMLRFDEIASQTFVIQQKQSIEIFQRIASSDTVIKITPIKIKLYKLHVITKSSLTSMQIYQT